IAGAVTIANRFHISERWIGMTLVAFGTSLPELVVTGYAASSGSPDVALSNVLGSNVANAWLALGVCALVSPSGRKNFRLSGEFWLSPLFIGVLGSVFILKGPFATVPIPIPAFFLIITCAYLFFFSGRDKDAEESAGAHLQIGWGKTSVYLILGLTALLAGSKWIVDGIVHISDSFGWSQTLLGYSVVAVGTSLPEIASSVSATMKGKHGLAIANVLGSNLINIGIVYGVTCFFDPIVISKSAGPALLAAIIAAFTAPLYTKAKTKIRNMLVFGVFLLLYFLSLFFVFSV
ncbi:MAG: sodium:calcium antiporter, partial [Candidatus Omnitrophica bacterium]|nr:sodium:calcium antiporter [Candidatus Omnitrophota bacterium]